LAGPEIVHQPGSRRTATGREQALGEPLTGLRDVDGLAAEVVVGKVNSGYADAVGLAPHPDGVPILDASTSMGIQFDMHRAALMLPPVGEDTEACQVETDFVPLPATGTSFPVRFG